MDSKKLLADYVKAGLLSDLEEEDDHCLSWFCRSLSSVDFPSDDDPLSLLLKLEKERYWADVAQEARFALKEWPANFIYHLSNVDEVDKDAGASLVARVTKLEPDTAKPLLRYFDKVFGDRPKTARQEWLDELGKALSSPALATIVHAFDFIMDGVKPDKWDDWVQDDLEKGRDMERECQFEDLIRRLSDQLKQATGALQKTKERVRRRDAIIEDQDAIIENHAAELAARIKSQNKVIVKNKNLRIDNAALIASNADLRDKQERLQSKLDRKTDQYKDEIKNHAEMRASDDKFRLEIAAVDEERIKLGREMIAELDAQVRSLSEKRKHDGQLLQGIVQTVQRVIAERDDDDDDDGGRLAKRRRTDLDIVSAPRPAPEDPPSP